VVPRKAWGTVFAIAGALTLLAVGAWEMRARALGYAPSYDDTPEMWSMWRDRIPDLDEPVVLVGDSRIRFDVDHATLSEAFGGRPVASLAMNGSVARPVLSLLAKDETFRGTAVVSYAPNLFWAPGGPNMDETMEWIHKHETLTPAARWSHRISLPVDATLAFVEPTDLALGSFLRGAIRLPNRPGVQTPPEMPPYICSMQFDRREEMWPKLETDAAFQERIQGIWRVLFSFSRPLPPDLLAKLRADVVADVRAIEARGGEVIFLRCPSTDWLREWENETAPRAQYWDPLIAETGCLGIHFEDYEELRNFDCPEWSHLSRADAVKFTEGVAKVLREKRGE